MRPSVLIISTTPPIPREYGNRNRVYQTWKFFERLGFEVSFLLYPFDSEWVSSVPEYYDELRRQFSYFDVIANSKKLHMKAEGFHHDIDEWWDDNIAIEVEWLSKRKRFDVVFVNYTFLSASFNYCNKKTLKILDTHDLFSGRRENFESNGVEPEFFYTNESEEQVAFDRADVVIGIKSAETEVIKGLTKACAICIPYYSDPITQTSGKGQIFLPAEGRTLKIGFIGAENSVNIVNMRRFLALISTDARLAGGNIEIHVAGNVCKGLQSKGAWCKLLGRVESIDDFYNSIDLIIAPLEFSTGIKIKVAEALSYGKPVVATENAFDGFKAFHFSQHCQNLAQICDCLFEVAAGNIDYSLLLSAAQASAKQAQADADLGFQELADAIYLRLERIYIVVDRPFWYRLNFIDEFIAQFVEYVTHLGQVVVISLSDEAPKPDRIYAHVDFVRCSIDTVEQVLTDISHVYKSAGFFNLTDAGDISSVAKRVRNFSVSSLWRWIRQDMSVDHRPYIGLEIDGVPDPIELLPLRYFPVSLGSMKDKKEEIDVVIYVKHPKTNDQDRLINLLTNSLKRTGRNFVELMCPDYQEFSEDFFFESCAHTPKIIFFVGPDCLAWSFLKSLFIFDKVPIFHLDERTLSASDMLGISETNFLENIFRDPKTLNASTSYFVGNNTGWDILWQRLAREKA